MNKVELKKDIYWVGGIDWELRDFHGYLTQRGSSYNSYLVIDEKVTLIDATKIGNKDELFKRISMIIDPSKIDVIICNHIEMDHSGCIPEILKVAPNAEVIASKKGIEGLSMHFDTSEWNLKTVKQGDSISTGKYSFAFVPTPMVHWPDNMVTYCPEAKILFSNDAFGQHLASTERFDDQLPLEIVMEEARKYYANIVLPYGKQVKKALDAVSGLEIDIIAPSHGTMWRKYIKEILTEYSKWCENKTEKKAIILYDTMWGSTKKIAYAIEEAFENVGYFPKMVKLTDTHMSDIMTDILTSEYICIGSPTLNSSMMPSVAAFLAYLRGLCPKARKGIAFGSYGWGGQGVDMVNGILENCGFDLHEPIKCKYIPTEAKLTEIRESLEEVLKKG